MADTVFNSWITALANLQASVAKDVEEIRQAKAEMQHIKSDLYNQLARGRYLRDDERLVLSAPEIIIGNVDSAGMLYGDGGTVVIRGTNVGLEGVGEGGAIESRASVISQTAVDPGPDGIEAVVRNHSAIINQAKYITIQSNEAETDGVFSRVPKSPAGTGVMIHADATIEIDASESSENRSNEISDMTTSLSDSLAGLTMDSTTAMANVTALVAQLEAIMTAGDVLNAEELAIRTSVLDIEELRDQFNQLIPSVYTALEGAIHTMSMLAETNRRIKALKAEETKVKANKAKFKDTSTDARLKVRAEQMDIASVDGDGNIRTNPEAAIHVQTGKLTISTKKEDGTLIDDSYVKIDTHDVTISTINPKLDNPQESDGEYTTEGSVQVYSKDVSFTAVDYTVKNDEYEEKDQTAGSRFSVRAEQTEFMSFDKDENVTGKFAVLAQDSSLSSEDKDGNATGSFRVKALDLELQSVDKDEKATGSLTMKAENIAASSVDKEGKALGQVSVNGKNVFIKAMDTDDKGGDKNLAAGGNMVVVAENMFVGRTNKDNTSKTLQISSDKTGIYGTTTAEMQQGEAKAVVQLDGGNIAISGSKAEYYGDNTVNGKTDFKADATMTKLTADNLEAKSSLKSTNISDGVAVPDAPSSAKLSAKLKEEDAPKPKAIEKNAESGGGSK